MTTLPRSDLTDGAGSLSETASPGTSELTRFSPAGSAPDASAIARMANAFYASPPSNPFPGPGAALPSAPVFAAEPIYNSLPGAPALQPPLSPNLNPGLPPMPIPASGAAQPSAPVFSVEPLLGQAQSSPSPNFGAPQGGKGGGAAPLVPPIPTPAAPLPVAGATSAPAAPQGIPTDADFAALPYSLGGVMSLIPSFNDAPSPYGPSGLNGPAMGSAVPSDNYAFLDRGAAPAYDPSPRSGVGATPGAVAGGSPARAQPFNYQVSVLDLSALNFQHRPELGAPAAGISGVRPFDPYAIKRDFPILHRNVNGAPLVWLDNAATTQKPQSVIDRLSYFYEHENSNIHRAAHTLAARATDAYEARARRCARFLNAPSPDEIIFVRGATEGINLIAQTWGGRNVDEGDEIVITQLEHHANIVPWQQLAAEKGAKLRVAPVDDRGQIILEEYEKLLSPKTRIVSVTQVSNALGTITPAQRDDRDGAPPRGHRAARRRAVGLAHAGRRAGARLRLLRVLRPQDVRPDRHRRRLRQVRACSKRCRPGRAAAT